MEVTDILLPVAVVVFFWLLYSFGIRERILGLPKENQTPEEAPLAPQKGKEKVKNPPKVKAKVKTDSSGKQFTHPWLAGTLKGHSDQVECCHFSPNGNFLVTCGADRTVRIWLTKDFKERDHKQIRVNIEFDSASRVQWSPDNKAFIISKKEERTVEVYKVGKRPDGSFGNVTKAPLNFSKVKDEIVGLGVACSGKFMMTCTVTGHLSIWDLKGTLLEEVSIANGTTQVAKVSTCGRYVGTCGQYDSNNLVIREVNFKNDQKYGGLTPVFAGTNHKQALYSFDYSTDSTRIVTLDTKGKWSLFDTTINRMDVTRTGISKEHPETDTKPVVKISGDGRLIIVGINANIEIYSTFSGEMLFQIESVHTEPIKDVQFSADDAFIITCGDNVINVFNNISGFQETIRDLGAQLSDKSLGLALRNRLSSQVSSLQTKLDELNK